MNPNSPLIGKGSSFVLAVAGGGSQAVAELLRHGGMSGTLLAAHVFQGRKATDRFVGATPDRYVAVETARALAMAAYQEARGLRPEGTTFGVGATSCLYIPGEREGRRHELHVGIQTRFRTHTFSYRLAAKRTREEEEALAAALVRRCVFLGAGVWPKDVPLDGADSSAADFCEGGDYLDLLHGPPMRLGPEPAKYVLASSCNPLHDGHLAMMKWVEERKGVPVDVELCVRNAEKPPLDYISIRDRVWQVEDWLRHEPAYGDLQLTNSGRFAAKLYGYPVGTTFLVGTDTIDRVDSQLTSEDREAFRLFDARFLVFPREGHYFLSSTLNHDLRARCEFVAEGFEPSTLSSTAIRKGRHA